MSIDCSATAKPCLLLDLPGEIRNLIYDLAIDDKYIPPLSLPIENPEHDLRGLWFKAHENYLLRPYELYLSRINASASAPREFPAIREVEEGEMDSKKVIQPFCSLTQVCRKIRSEYLPFYQRINTYYVCHLDLQDYLDYVLREECKQAACQYADSLYDPLSDQIDRRQYLNCVHEEELAYRQRMIRNIRINCRLWDERVGRGRDRNYNKESAVDILPFLNFCATAPGIRVKCGFSSCKCCQKDWYGLRELLDAIFDVGRRPWLATWLKVSVEAVILNWPPFLNFRMKEGHRTRWMRYISLSYLNHFQDDEKIRWMQEVGLERNQQWDLYKCLRFSEFDPNWRRDAGAIEVEDSEIVESKAFWEEVKEGRRSKRLPIPKTMCGKAKLERAGRGNGRHR